jgi:hypothetical protein
MIIPAKRRQAAGSGSGGLGPQTKAWETPLEEIFGMDGALSANAVKGKVFRVLRESIPLLDVGINKIKRLCGTFSVDCQGNTRAQEFINAFIRDVLVNDLNFGMQNAVIQAIDSALEQGNGYVELVPTALENGVEGLYNANSERVGFTKVDGRWALGAIQRGTGKVKPFDRPEFIYQVAPDKRKGQPSGVSMLYGLPFVGNVFQRIVKTIDNQLQKVGDPSFVLVVEPGNFPSSNPIQGMKQAHEIAGGVTTALKSDMKELMKLRRQGKMTDLHTTAPPGGTVKISTLGADAEVMPLEVPMRTIMEMFCAKTEIPPAFFGFSWSSTERMTTEQRKMLAKSIGAYRVALEGMIDAVLWWAFNFAGFSGTKYTISWDEVGLQDEVETAKARLYGAQAEEKEIRSAIWLLDSGFVTAEEVIEDLQRKGILPAKLSASRANVLQELRKRAYARYSAVIANDLLGSAA